MKKVLMIYTAFYPENAIGSIRNTKLMKYLVREGYEVTVITTRDKLTKVEDPTLYCDELKHVRLVEIPYSNFFKKYLLKQRNAMKDSSLNTTVKKSSKVKEYIIRKLKTVSQEIFTLLRNNDWKTQVMKHMRKVDNDYDIIISGYPSLSTHQIARKLKNRNNLWIADFRDPIPYKSLNSKITYFYYKRLQKKYSRKADRVVYLSESSLPVISKDVKDKGKFILVPNGFDLEDLVFLENSKSFGKKIFRIAYVGGLYGGKRDLSFLFSSLSNLIKDNKIQEGQVEMHYAGKDFMYLKEQFNSYNLKVEIVNHGYVNRLESLLIQKNSDLIVINTWNTKEEKGIVTGKIYEAFLLKKQILGIVNGTVPNSELKTMIHKSKLGIAYEEAINYMNDISLEDYLFKLISRKYASDNNFPFEKPDFEYISKYDFGKLSQTLVDIIENGGL